MGKKMGLVGVLVFLSLFLSVHSVQAQVKTQKITCLEEPSWFFKTGMSRGKYHDRQDLGLVLNSGATIKIRKSNTSDGYKNLNFRILGNNRNAEKSVSLTGDWQTIKIESSGVPFIDTPYGTTDTEIEYEIEGSATPLPIYQKNTSEAKFFSEWDGSDAAFALVKGDKFQLLIPLAEKNKTKRLPDFDTLDTYMTYQDSIITYYDDTMGLSSTTGLNKTPKNRFFLKGDGGTPSGVGAYYGNDYTANGYSTVVGMWMSKWDWGTLHELGHAYQPSYNNKGMYTGEVSNNLLAVLFTYEHRGKTVGDKNSWLYNYNKKKSVEDSLYQLLVGQQKRYADLDHRRRLVLLSDLTQSVGKENWTKFNIFYREAINNGNIAVKNLSLPDLFTLYYSDQTKKDYSPIFNKWGLSLTATRQPTINRGNDYPAVSSLVDVVPKDKLDEAVTALSQNLLIDSKFNLVTNQDLVGMNLSGGSLTIHLKIDEFAQLKGKTLALKDGQRVVKEVMIDSPELVIPSMKNGIYTMAFPETEKRYDIDNHYAYVRDTQNDTQVKFTALIGSQLFDETITFRGWSYEFATIKTDFQNQNLTFDVFTKNPHSRFAGELYASLKVFDELGNLVYEKDIDGTNAKVEKVDVPLKEGFQIQIFHAETKNRLTSTTTGLIDAKRKTNILLVKNGYLVNQNGAPDTASRVEKIISAIGNLKRDPAISEIKDSPEKNQIIVAILALPEKDRDELLIAHQDFLNLSPGVMTLHYLDEDKQVIAAPDSVTGRFGESRQFQAKNIPGYKLKVGTASIELHYQLKPISHTFIYKKVAEPVLPKHKLVLRHVNLIQGDAWDPELAIAELIKDDAPYDFSDAVKSGLLTYTPKTLNTDKVGVYEVNYSYAGVTSVANITVKASQQSIDAKDSMLFIGDKWSAEDNFISATDKSGHVISFKQNMVSHDVDMSKAGIYRVSYRNGSAIKTITVIVKERSSATHQENTQSPKDKSGTTGNSGNAYDKAKDRPKVLPKTGETNQQIEMLVGITIVLTAGLVSYKVRKRTN